MQKNAGSIDFSEAMLESAAADIPKGSSQNKARLWMASTKACISHDKASFNDGDYIMFGKESAGIPENILETDIPSCIRIPMAPTQRSLNLSNSVAVVLYEALRQAGYPGLETCGKLSGHPAAN